MGIIICQVCDRTIDHVEDEKVTKLYGTCPDCKTNRQSSTQPQN